MNETYAHGGEKPLLRRIVDFPLIAMVTAILLFAFATALALRLGTLVPWTIGRDAVAAAHAVITIAIVLATYKVAIARLGEHPRDDLPFKGALPNLGLGFLAGFVIFSAVVGVAAVFDVYNIFGVGDASNLVHAVIATAIMPAFMEELLFRGILFRWIEEFGGTWAGLIISSALFGLAHLGNPGATWVAAVWIALEAGLLLGGAYMLTGNLWMPIGLHAAWNFTQGEIFDVPVSGIDEHGLVQAKLSGPEILTGGMFGLEASIIALVIATAAGAFLIVLAVRRGRVMQPWWVPRRLASAAA
jgi:membrane protease YdiL (CAAX protease family)